MNNQSFAHEEVSKENENDYYWMSFKCRNCFFQGSLAILKGKFAENAVCPKCQCSSLEPKKPPFN